MLKKVLLAFIGASLFTCTAWADKLEDVKKAGVLKAGVKYDFKPFGYVNENGKVVGFDIDLLKYIAKKLGVDIKFQQVTSKTRIPLVAAGKLDISAASMTHKVQRDDSIDFTISYFFDGQSILTSKDSKKRSAKGFAGKKVGAIKGATSGKNFKRVQPKAKIVYFNTYPEALSALKRRKIDAITTDYVWCSTQAKESKGALKVVGGLISKEPYGMGVPENESNFRDAINFAIQDAVRDGKYQKLYKKWFGKKPKRLPEVWPK